MKEALILITILVILMCSCTTKRDKQETISQNELSNLYDRLPEYNRK